MAIEQPTTLRVVHAGEIVDAEYVPSGVPGLAVVGRPLTTGWRLVHIATGRAVSRSAEHTDLDAVRDLASRIAPLADWTEPNVAVSVPRLRQELDRVITAWRALHGGAPVAGPGFEQTSHRSSDQASHQGFSRSAPLPPAPERDLTYDLETLADRLRAAEHERHLLREIVRRLHGALAPGVFADALSNLSHGEREFVRSLVADENAEDATGVVQAIRRGVDVTGPRTATTGAKAVGAASATRPAPASPRPASASPRPAPASPRSPTRRREGRFDGPDIAAS